MTVLRSSLQIVLPLNYVTEMWLKELYSRAKELCYKPTSLSDEQSCVCQNNCQTISKLINEGHPIAVNKL